MGERLDTSILSTQQPVLTDFLIAIHNDSTYRWNAIANKGKRMATGKHQRDQAISKGSRSFALASTLLPATERADVRRLYSWCRHCDDLIDNQTLGQYSENNVSNEESKTDVLMRLRVLSKQAIAGIHSDFLPYPFDDLRSVATSRAIPGVYPQTLLNGLSMDVSGRSYETIDDTIDYAYHVAGVVGLMMGHILGATTSGQLARAADLGIAFQLTNIARDVGEDLKNERVYLPRTWLNEAGLHVLDHDTIRSEAGRRAVFAVTSRLLATADAYYESAESGIAKLPFRTAWSIASASLVYRQIGREILASGPHFLYKRASVSLAIKLLLVAQALWMVLRLKCVITSNNRSGLVRIPIDTKR